MFLSRNSYILLLDSLAYIGRRAVSPVIINLFLFLITEACNFCKLPLRFLEISQSHWCLLNNKLHLDYIYRFFFCVFDSDRIMNRVWKRNYISYLSIIFNDGVRKHWPDNKNKVLPGYILSDIYRLHIPFICNNGYYRYVGIIYLYDNNSFT